MTLPTEQQARKHGREQDAPLTRAPNSRDRGVTQVGSVEDGREIIQHEISVWPATTYRLRAPGQMTDPLALIQEGLAATRAGLIGSASASTLRRGCCSRAEACWRSSRLPLAA